MAFFDFCDLELASEPLLFSQNERVAFAELGELLLQSGGLLSLLAQIGFHGGELFAGEEGIGGTALKLLTEVLDVRLGVGVLLLQFGLPALEAGIFLVFGLELRLDGLGLLFALARGLTGAGQFAR